MRSVYDRRMFTSGLVQIGLLTATAGKRRRNVWRLLRFLFISLFMFLTSGFRELACSWQNFKPCGRQSSPELSGDR